MANRRMFSKIITSSSYFLMMPSSTQLLYFHLGMYADDDGFVELITVKNMIKAAEEDVLWLVKKGYLEVFDEIMVGFLIHWRENNDIRWDRYTPSRYQYLKSSYSFGKETLKITTGSTTGSTTGIPLVARRLGKVRLGNKLLFTNVNNNVEMQSIYDLYISLFNKNSNKYQFTTKRKQKIKARLQDAGFDMLTEAIKRTSQDSFYRGANDRGWEANLDFIIRSYEQVERLSQLKTNQIKEYNLEKVRTLRDSILQTKIVNKV